MIKPAVLSVLASVALCSGLGATEAIKVERGQLACGDVMVRIESRCMSFEEHEKQCVSQRVTIGNESRHFTRTLRSDARRITQPFLGKQSVLDTTITGWGCLTAVGGARYIYLSYTCVENRRAPECVGTNKEWRRLFDTKGNELGAGLQRRSPDLPRLMGAQGLQQYVDEGIQLRDVFD
jgi:hypothetical protein